MTTGLAMFSAVLHLAAGIWLLAMNSPGFWLRAAFAAFMFGSTVRDVSLSLAPAGGFISTWCERGLKAMCVMYVVAGALGIIGAFSSLDGVFASISTFFLVGWIWVWALVLKKPSNWSNRPSSLPTR